MASPPRSMLCFLFLLNLSISISSSPLNPYTSITTISLSHFTSNPHPSPWQKLNHLAAASLTRARHLKTPQSKRTAATTPLSTHSYGGYSISLGFGTPPQTIQFIMDTGSGFVWFPCTRHYQCKNCSFSSSIPTPIQSFIPKMSSSSKILGCLNPKCGWIHDSDSQSRCRDCQPSFTNCTQICPPYIIIYGSGNTGGVLLSETLNIDQKRVSDFIVGCSLFSSRQPAGIAGFGRGAPSLPGQLGLKKFSYCLLSHKFDDTSESSSLVLNGGADSGEKTPGVSYTPFLKNPQTADNPAFSVYYYVGLRKITVGDESVKIPYKYRSPGTEGSGGTIVDSGTTFTFMTGEVFELVAGEFEKQVRGYARAREIEALTGLRPCFNVSNTKTVSLPELSFRFKGGAQMKLPLANYFSIVGDAGTACMTIVTDRGEGVGFSGGPSIILGNFQMQNYYVEYDLGNERLGFRQQPCK